ncbi:MAG: methylenetetrahydrofolate reductase [bacterium]
MNFKQALEKKLFTVTAEIAPPKGTDISACLEEADLIKELVDGINVTDNQRAIMRLSPVSLCHKFVQKGYSPILQMTCRDRNRIALQADLLSASVLGIENLLLLTGDSITAGDHPDAKDVFDLDSVSLLKTAARLNSGYDLHDRKLNGSPQFLLGAAVNPGADPKEMQVIQMIKKILAGADFFQTQLVFDIDDFKLFLKLLKDNSVKKVKILAGIFPLKTAKQARFLNEKVPGVKIPEALISRLERSKNQEQEGIEIAWEIIKQLQNICAGVHLMTMGNKDILVNLLKRIKTIR